MNKNCIPLEWIKKHIDTYLEIVEKLDEGPMKDATLKRIDYYLDLVEAFRKSNE